VNHRTIAGLALASALATSLACTRPAENVNVPANTPPTNASNTNGGPTAQSFAPGSAQDIALHQPDYRATVTVKTTIAPAPAKSSEVKIAKLGDAWRIEQQLPAVGNTITFIRPGQPTLQVLVDKKQYLEYKDGGEVNPIVSTLKGLTTPGVDFEKVGTELVGSTQATKFRGTKSGETGELFLYASPDLKNLIVRVAAQKENVTFDATWTDIALDVTPEAVAPPADLTTAYKKIEEKDYGAMFSEGGGSGDVTAASSAPAAAPPK